MKVLVVGGGGREHAIVHALSRSPRVTKLWCAPGNGGIASEAECINIKATDVPTMVGFAVQNGADFVVVAPDDPLALGMVDAMEAAGIPAFGPRKNAAVIESSKVFSKGLMEKYGIPTAKYRVFDSMDAALSYVRSEGAPLVVKADGLALGKGVVVAQTLPEAEAAVRRIMEDKIFGESGARIVIEECLTGPEVTVLCFTDGKTIRPMPSSQDHKRALDGNRGPNTGGMGAISPSRHYTPELAARCMEEIFLPTLRAMNAEDRPFWGVLYFGLMLTEDGPKVIEYNARFGDPEAQAVLSLLKTDLLEIMLAVTEERLEELEIQWENGASCCLVLASGGYPGSYQTGFPIEGLDAVPADITVYHAGTRAYDGRILTSGGRVLGVTAAADTLDKAVDKAYAAVRGIRFEGMQYRTDIGKI
ncbi:phosphoribosylamine--glycine ligase [Papillibacter cinnamivorans]|uniref:Phosphoribosylamine--glycine ligase n=1 Tax=Papillibacter cinnamivorans DSM 12816 TaxID=1122930 RepID=A0A1W1Z2B5_9FIRM|nr:phosphoribosylamine--glycine ligase [Papillibacter cinnamivorans]SMC42595.1 phosphoribosylamine--glycine ligase [Papillibacter cinnamivorans DSM 12816]